MTQARATADRTYQWFALTLRSRSVTALRPLPSCDHGVPPGGCGRQAELLPAGVDYLAAPATYAATM